jgi:hypothetical protein
MLVTFSCKEYEDIVMLGDVAKRLLHMMGESGIVPGAIMAEDLPNALANLEAGIKKGSGVIVKQSNPNDEDEKMDVNLATRAFPLINMLQVAIEHHCNVMWE